MVFIPVDDEIPGDVDLNVLNEEIVDLILFKKSSKQLIQLFIVKIFDVIACNAI